MVYPSAWNLYSPRSVFRLHSWRPSASAVVDASPAARLSAMDTASWVLMFDLVVFIPAPVVVVAFVIVLTLCSQEIRDESCVWPHPARSRAATAMVRG